MTRRVLLATSLALISSFTAHAETLQQYVQSCKTELAFESVPDLNCYDSDVFAPNEIDGGILVNDHVGYARLNDNVDLTFACRWLLGSKAEPQKAFSIEMMIHNRGSGKTCFFSAKEQGDRTGGQEQGNTISPLMLSITGPNASEYWESPAHVANPPYPSSVDHVRFRQCATCHIKGPYIVSPRIAPFLAKYGILNNGHDNFRSRQTTTPPGYTYATGKGYLAVAPSGSEFAHFNDIIYGTVDRKAQYNADLVPPQSVIVNDFKVNVVKHTNDCSGSCHDIVAGDFPRPMVFGGGGTLLPSIHDVISSIGSRMPPYGAANINSSYRWVNDDSLGDNQDIERFSEINNPQKGYLKKIYSDCATPTLTQARAVGSDFVFGTDHKFPDALEYFNVKQGLKCTVSQQGDGQCNDYEVRYYCPGTNNGKPYWSHRYAESWYDVDDPTNSADEESRQNLANAGVNLCGGQKPLDIQARTRVGSRVYSYVGPRDRLAKFATDGLECKDSEQPDFGQTNGQHACSNYSVRYTYCDGKEVPAQPEYFEITVKAAISRRANSGDYAEMRVYVDDIPMNEWDAAERLDPIPQSHTEEAVFKTFTYRTNATGELRIVSSGPLHVHDVTVNGLGKLPLQRTSEPGEKIIVRARGISGSETIRLTAGGQEVARFNLSTAWKLYTAHTHVYGGVNVEFINDATGRDVDLDWVQINGFTHQAENQTYNTATFANGRCGGAKGSMMHCGSNTANSGVIGFAPVVNYHAGKVEISYGPISSLSMPDVVTVQDRYDETSSGFCANLIAYNTTGTAQNTRFDFNIGTYSLQNTYWNFNPQGVYTGVIHGLPSSPLSLPPLSRSDNAARHYWFCAK